MRVRTFCLALLLIAVACQSTPTPITPNIVTSIPTSISNEQVAINKVQTPTTQITGHNTQNPTLTPPSSPVTWPPTPTINSKLNTQNSKFPPAPLPLSAYPRPPGDNGLGIHWSTHLYAQSDEATSYFVSELSRMNIKWVKLLVDGLTNHDYDRTIDDLVSRDIMPIIRIYRRCNHPYDAGQLDALVRHYVTKGVYYYDLYNEPNQPGESGGWCEAVEQDPAYLAQIWADAARTIYLAGGYPGLPSFFAPDQKRPSWPDSFFHRFFNALREQGNQEVLYFSWASVHNYNINHPPTYPYDEVNQSGHPLTAAEIARYGLTPPEVQVINLNREVAGILKQHPLDMADAQRLDLSETEMVEINRKFAAGELMGFNLYDDSTAFFHFIAYRNQFYDIFGFDIPIISTEGGATRGSSEDPRYPKVDGQTVAEWTLWSADYMLNDAPPYYFATNTWLLAQGALDYNEPVWEINTWYHDREGNQEPVVDALKNRPRLNETRTVCQQDDLACWQANVTIPQPNKNPLENYPRPSADNGRGIHWSPTNQKLPPQVVDYFMAELRTMNIKWVKFLQDDVPTITDPYLVEQLVAHDIEPVLRVFKPFNQPYQHLIPLVTQAKTMGINYFELYNEPNLAGPAGGWREGEAINVERMVDLWILAARDVHSAGGHPSLPALAGGGAVDDMLFLRQFLDGLRARGQAGLLPGAWIAVHNYFLNHPLDYPADPVNVADVLLTEAEIEERELTPEQVEAINHARSIAKLPREQGGFWVGNTIDEDSNSFTKFEAYANIFYSRFGYHLPVISTEGGAIIGSADDPRYPPVTEEDLTALTLAAYHALLDDAPPYFFAHTSWLLANSAGEHSDERFEHAAWYKDRAGTVLPVVEALKADLRKNEMRQ